MAEVCDALLPERPAVWAASCALRVLGSPGEELLFNKMQMNHPVTLPVGSAQWLMVLNPQVRPLIPDDPKLETGFWSWRMPTLCGSTCSYFNCLFARWVMMVYTWPLLL